MKSVAAWDEKRAVCGNCKHIYLKAQSRVAEFCSVDCHATTQYLETVQKSIHALHIVAPLTPPGATPVTQTQVKGVNEVPHTFAEFHTTKLRGSAALPSRLLKSINSWKGSPPTGYDKVHTLEEHTAAVPDRAFACRLAQPLASPPHEDASPVIYDVLLHKDPHGLGFCLAMDDQHRLVVTSFRRMHANDVGPAEASCQIRQGDYLREVNGDEVFTLQQVHRLLLLHAEAFVLLRFQRGASVSPVAVPTDVAAIADTVSPRSVPVPTQRERQLVHLVDDLSLKNKLLHTQLAHAHVQLQEQTLQKETLERQVQEARIEAASAARSSRLWPRASHTKSELDTLVTECRLQLQRDADEQLLVERTKLITNHREELQRLEARSAKKLRMLEEALGFLIDQIDALSHDANPATDDALKLQDIRSILDKYSARRHQIDLLVRDPTTSVTSA
ncbi:hypothetical protein ACHHYP_02889 [Achlya hypogyna]|uniref:PDZ domain-containing protein n=1 Tax=Achlya hypogyna TaxID=1202772 RepID=A0A1V9ZRM4_ACHHY|nr:hypothetical protein ACHHYP_02889 [Achlya hypogyna]